MTSMSNFTGGRNEKNINPCTVLIAGTLLLLCCIALVSRIQNLNTEQDFDVLIFTQRWPNTACLEWEEKTKPPHNCTFPRKGGHWVIHGIWPTKLGTKGPNFCNSTLPFNVTALNPIRSDLDEYWTDIEIGSKHKNNSFWKHEWLKHGTCASSIESLNTEIKYFQQALKWRQEYSMQEVLSLMGIKPTGESHGYNVDEFVKAVNDAIGKNPFIGCIHDTKTGLPFLSEIRICFDKNLLLTDCDGIKVKSTNPRSWHTSSVLTNCPQNKLIIYPSEVPPRDRQLLPRHEHYLVHLYKVLTFLQWFTS